MGVCPVIEHREHKGTISVPFLWVGDILVHRSVRFSPGIALAFLYLHQSEALYSRCLAP